MRLLSFTFFCFLALLPRVSLAGERTYTESSPILAIQTQNEVQDALLTKIRRDALNDTGVYIKKTATMDENQNLSESTTSTMARLIKIDPKSIRSELIPNGSNPPVLSVTATVIIDDNELKGMVSKVHEMNAQHAQNETLKTQINHLLKQNAVTESHTNTENAIAAAAALRPGHAGPSTSPDITLNDLLADVPIPAAPRVPPSYEQSCSFFRKISDSIAQDGYQNHLHVKLVRIYHGKGLSNYDLASQKMDQLGAKYRSGGYTREQYIPLYQQAIKNLVDAMASPTSPDQLYAEVSISGTLDWDWSRQAQLVHDFLGSAYEDNGISFKFYRQPDYKHMDWDEYQKRMKDVSTDVSYAWLYCMGFPRMTVSLFDGTVLFNYDPTNYSGDGIRYKESYVINKTLTLPIDGEQALGDKKLINISFVVNKP